MPGQMYFGNRARMTWVKCPDSGMGMGGSRYSSEGVFLNGGAFVRNSATGHRAYDMSWNFLRADEKDAIRSYLDGVYGTGLLYFLDPFAMRRNVLPTAWAAPGVAVDGGPRLLGGMSEAPVAATPAGPETLLRTNLINNPMPASTNDWFSPAGDPLTLVTEGGQNAIEVLNNSGDNAVYTYPRSLVTPDSSLSGSAYLPSAALVPGAWIAFSAEVRALDTSVAAAMRLVLQASGTGGTFAGGATTVTLARPVSNTGYVRISGAVQIATVSAATYFRTIIWPGNASAVAGSGFRFRKVVRAIASTEAAALAAVATYFDGATTDTATRRYDWQGAANASLSTETALSVPEGIPVQGAKYTVDADSEFKKLWVPIPPGHTLHITAPYSRTGTAALTVTPDNGVAATLPPTGTPTTVSGTGATLSLAGLGTITLGYMMAQVLPTGQTPDFSRFYPGIGHSGARLSGDINDIGYSSPQALDFSALSFTLRETGSWE